MASWLSLRAAVHDLDRDGQDWVDAIQTEVREEVDDGLGTFVYTYRIAADATIQLDHLAGHESAPAFWQALELWGAENQRALGRIYRTGTTSLDEAMRTAGRAGVRLTESREAFEAHGVADVLAVVGHDQNGFGVFATSPRRRCWSNDRSQQAKQSRLLDRLAVELAMAARIRESARRSSNARLSTAEVQVAQLLIEGASDKTIASALGVTLSTVSTFTGRVRKKLGCRAGEEALLLRPRMERTILQRRLAVLERLSNAECDVVAELLVGSSYVEIATRRAVSERTVASQCASIFRKCGVTGRRELAALLVGSKKWTS